MPRHRFASIRSLAFGAALTAVAPAHAQICAPFTDVAAADPFCTSIQWMRNRGITLGCTTDQYCPADNVRRDQMAAFMFRLGNVVHQQGGNAFGATAVLGTTDGHALDLRANGERVMRFEPNTISPNVIGGSPANGATTGVRGATIAGGGVPAGDTDPDFNAEAPNRVTDIYGTVGGGVANVAGNDDPDPAGTGAFATVAGGVGNAARGTASLVGGGLFNVADGQGATVGGGSNNEADALYPTVAGGLDNLASGSAATVGGGALNTASGDESTVPGGAGNVASGIRSFAAGSQSEARGDHSIALGRRAKTFVGANPGHGTIVLADGNAFDFAESFDNRFAVRATGGVRFVVDIDATGAPTWSCLVTAGNSWSCSSDRNLKQDFERLDGAEVLDRLTAMPVYAWSPKGRNAHVRHYGPTAQDFHAAFGLGDDATMIGMQDADGVALAAIQGLNAKLEAKVAEQAREIAALRERHAALSGQAREIAELRHLVDGLLARLGQRGDVP